MATGAVPLNFLCSSREERDLAARIEAQLAVRRRRRCFA